MNVAYLHSLIHTKHFMKWNFLSSLHIPPQETFECHLKMLDTEWLLLQNIR
jgi:hypothetical protein